MPDDILPFDKTKDPALSRRAFGALSFGAGAAVTASAMAAGAVVETDVVIKMADGSCDAALFYPLGSGSWPGAVILSGSLSAQLFRTSRAKVSLSCSTAFSRRAKPTLSLTRQ